MTLVLCNGVFDLLHIGHIRHLQEARAMGTHLVVGVTMDAYVGKPDRPIQQVEERMEMLKALYCVSAVSLCRNSLEALDQWKPNIFCKGPDYKGRLLREEIEFCHANKIAVKYTTAPKYSTTELIARVKQCA